METHETGNRLEHNIALVHELLRRHRLTEQLIRKGDSPKKELL